MNLRISEECGELLDRQEGVIGRLQGLEFGLSADSMRHRVRTGEWQLTTAPRLRRALEKRARFRDRPEAESALADAGQGALSNLERWYLRGVERRHKLPVATRQSRIKVGGQSIYLDNLYEACGVCVELDGTAAHPADEQWLDKRRDNANAVSGLVTLRFGLLDLGDRRCETASAVATLLRRRGWTGSRRACGPGCTAAFS